MKKDKINYRLVNILLLLAILSILLFTSKYWLEMIGYVINLLLPFIIAFAIAYALYPFVRKVQKMGTNKMVAVAIVSLIVILTVTGLLTVTVPILYNQLVSFATSIIDGIQNFATNLDINMGSTSIRLEDMLNNLLQNIGEFIPKEGFAILNSSINFISQTLIVIILSIYFLSDMDKIRAYIKKLYSRRNKKAFKLISEIDTKMSKYISGLFLLMLITVIEYLIIYRLIGHPNWLIIGLLMMIAPIIPYIGGIIVNFIGIITAYAAGTPVFVATIIIVFISSTLDGYIIGPKVHGKSNNIHPMVGILSIFIASAILGPMGIIVAIPLYIIVSTVIRFYEDDIKEKLDDMKN